MTKNQIDYWRNQEQERTNRAQELQAKINQRWKEHVDFHTLKEQHRTNVANEGIKERTHIEQDQHYRRMDAEQQRANMASESLRAESNRIAKENVILGYHQSEVSRANAREAASAARYGSNLSASVGMANVTEQHRANVVHENEQTRSNLANEYLTSLQRGAQGRDVAVREGQLQLEQQKWNDSVVTAQRQANLENTRANTMNTVQGAVDRRVSTITQGVNNLAGAIGNIARGGRNYIVGGQ